ncbi:Flp pilus assembly protein CpaB [Castellaniella sp. S9]|uniref:Flp pilus assembly protein CpaB n=1 Tax=Castellaniella sp. S9 TaxID=2993652 RepID=UPI0022B50436|nr:Flp pilus assembly protein CpaB [Castellaniella sp. S9]
MRRFRMPRSAVLGVLALSAGLLAAWALDAHVRERVAGIEARARVPMAERVVAAHDLPAGTRLRAEHLALRRMPLEWLSSDSVPAARHAGLLDTVLTAPLKAGDPVLLAHTQAAGPAFSSQLALGRRAITLPVDQINSLSGLLQPGDLIDLYVSFEYQRRRMTAPLLQGVLVLATGRATRFDGGAEGTYSTVTLDAAPEDVVKLVAARQGGSITAILRHPDDPLADRRAVRGDLAALLGVASAPPPPRRKGATVVYGTNAGGRVPGLNSPAPSAARPAGLFDLPEAQALASAWMQAARDMSDEAEP